MTQRNIRRDVTHRCLPKGFTLIELLVVVLIIGILAAIALPQYNKAVAKARATEIVVFLRAVSQGVDLYELEHGAFGENSGIWFFRENGINELEVDVSSIISCGHDDGSYYCYANSGKWKMDTLTCDWIEGDEQKCATSIIDTHEEHFSISVDKHFDNTWTSSCRSLGTAYGDQFCAVFNSL